MRRLAALLALSMGCTPLPTAPRLITDAARVDASSDRALADAADAPLDTLDAPSDATLDAPSDATLDAPADLPADAPLDASADVPPDALADAPLDALADAPRFTGGFVSSAVTAAGSRLSGGFTWHGASASTRLEGWVR